MKKITILLSLFVMTISLFAAFCFHSAKEKPFVVVITSYNNKKWAKKNIDSVINQKYKNFRIIYINDCSRDETSLIVKNLLVNHPLTFQSLSFDDSATEIPEATANFQKLVNDTPCFFTLVDNVNRAGALANLYRAIHSCKDHEIIVTVDGDDWLRDNKVLKRLNKAYTNNPIWLTHGKLIEYPGGSTHWCEPVPPEIIARNAFREFKCPSHLRTFYTWLFKKIELEDLLYEKQFFTMTWDMAIMYPMIEMSGEKHAFLSTPNYVYNMANPINDNKVNADLQNALDRYIREAHRYQKLEQGPLEQLE